MDPDVRALISELGMRAGMIMEDASTLAITLPGVDDARIQAALTQLQCETAAIANLLSAAATLAKRASAG
jgi:hypothetical protein